LVKKDIVIKLTAKCFFLTARIGSVEPSTCPVTAENVTYTFRLQLVGILAHTMCIVEKVAQ